MEMKQNIIAENIDQWQPVTIEHLISPHTDYVRELLGYYWTERAYGKKDMPFPPILMYATRDGLGRKCLGKIIASELGYTFTEKVGYWLSRNGAELVDLFETPNTLLFLETNKYNLSTPSVNLILRLLDNPKELVFTDPFSDVARKFEASSDFSLILSTENAILFDTFKDRFPIVLRFNETMYSKDELEAILHQRIKALNWSITDAAESRILTYAHLIPQTLMLLLQLAWVQTRAAGKFEITFDHVKKARSWLHQNGMGPPHAKEEDAS